MALINCKECDGQVSKKANICPHCGNKLKSKSSGCFWIILIALVAFCGYVVNHSDSSSTNSGSSYSISHPDIFLAYNYAENAVKKKLKSPSTAEFPGTIEKSKHINYLGGGEYQINSWVDSQNSFGAIIRSNFRVIIVFNDNKASYENLKVE
jgi:hypothetical protein